jgi:hypothetical protein
MININEFVDFILKNLDDPRIEINKSIKFGYNHYTVHFLVTNTKMTPSIHVDLRNNFYSLSFDWEESILIEDPEKTKEIADILEEKYKKDIPTRIDDMVNKIFSSTDPENKDFWRDWTLNKLMSDDGSKL